jgi:hypothetical protein
MEETSIGEDSKAVSVLIPYSTPSGAAVQGLLHPRVLQANFQEVIVAKFTLIC